MAFKTVNMLQVICYGLSLPFSDHDIVKECVNIYCEWLSGCLIKKKLCVPKPVLQEPAKYSSIMLSHLYNLFVPREKPCKHSLRPFRFPAVCCLSVHARTKCLSRDTSEKTDSLLQHMTK